MNYTHIIASLVWSLLEKSTLIYNKENATRSRGPVHKAQAGHTARLGHVVP